jgi:hypothetical protein
MEKTNMNSQDSKRAHSINNSSEHNEIQGVYGIEFCLKSMLEFGYPSNSHPRKTKAYDALRSAIPLRKTR